MSEAQEIFTVSEAARHKGVHRKSVYRAIRAGRLQAEPHGNTVLIRRAALEAWRGRRGRFAKSEQ